MANRIPFVPEEWYHCYNRGVDKRRIFENGRDYQRFLQLLYLCNDQKPLHSADMRKWSHEEILLHPRNEPLVAIGTYSLMSNHYHLLLKALSEKGISKFMQKLGVAYTMYFNKKNDRTGNLLMRPFRSKHVEDDRYFRRVAQYIHLNAAELFEPGWKKGQVKNFSQLKKQLEEYRYSSLTDYVGCERPELAILNSEATELIRAGLLPIDETLSEMTEYYSELSFS